MSAPGITFGQGITIGQGVTVGGSAFSFTLASADFAATGGNGGATGSPTPTTSGFTVAAGNPHLCASYIGANLGSVNGVSDTYLNNLASGWTGAGLDTSHSYAFNVSWTGGSPGSTVAFVSFYNPSATNGNLVIAPVSTSDNNWRAGTYSLYNLRGAPGTYNFPATFTLVQPKVQDDTSWC